MSNGTMSSPASSTDPADASDGATMSGPLLAEGVVSCRRDAVVGAGRKAKLQNRTLQKFPFK